MREGQTIVYALNPNLFHCNLRRGRVSVPAEMASIPTTFPDMEYHEGNQERFSGGIWNASPYLKERASQMDLIPLGDRLIVERIDDTDSLKKTELGEAILPSGIVIPDTAKPKPLKGTVMAVGEGRIENGERIPLDVVEGDTVFFGKFSGSEFEHDGKSYLVMCETDIIAKLRQ